MDSMNVAERAVLTVEGAADPGVLLGADPARRYKELSRLVHPDRFPGDIRLQKRALAAKQKLDQFHDRLVPNTGSKSPVRIGAWVVTAPLAKGDIADLHRVEGVDAPHAGVQAVLKIAQSPRDNDLIKNEREILTLLHKPSSDTERGFRHYLPRLLDSFVASGRAANVLAEEEGFLPLTDITGLFPVFHPRHVIWTMNRALSALGYIHRQGVVHGGITPRHLMYNKAHDLRMVDWCYAATTGNRVRAIVSAYEPDYAPEILRKQPVGPQTDLYMLARAIKGTGARIPRGLSTLLDLCMIQSPASRPEDAWAFEDRWKAAAKKEYGEPSWFPLEFPVN